MPSPTLPDRIGLKLPRTFMRRSVLIGCLVTGVISGSPTIARGGACMLSRTELAQWRSASDLIIVDTRSAADFRRVRIAGSINLPAGALRTKAYLKDKPLLLVGRTGRGIELEPICEELREAGFARVGVIEGGLSYWAHQGGALTGGGRREVDRLSPADLAREASADGWLLIDVSPPSPAPSPKLRRSNASSGEPGKEAEPLVILRLPFEKGKQFRTDVEAAIANHGGEATFVLLTNRDGKNYDRIARELEPLAIDHLYFLTDGLDGYRRYKEQQRQIGESMARGCTLNECGTR